MSRLALAALLALLCAPPTVAQDRPEPMQPNEDGDYLPDPSQEMPLDEAQLIAAFTDKTHRGTYNFKRPEIDTFAFAERTTADGRTRHQHGDKVDVGTWRVRRNVICFEYEEWTEGSNHIACFNIFRRGNCYYHYALRARGFGVGGAFTARSVHEGETPECEPAFV